MKRELVFCQLAERSISKKYRKEIWNPFIAAVKRYELVEPGDKIAVCVSGGKDSMLLAKLMQMLQRYTETPFELVFLMMDPGYAPENRQLIAENAALLRIPLHIFETDVFQVANEGKMVCVVAPEAAEAALAAMRTSKYGADAAIIGEVGDMRADRGPKVYVRNAFGGRRILDMLVGEQLPRIC